MNRVTRRRSPRYRSTPPVALTGRGAFGLRVAGDVDDDDDPDLGEDAKAINGDISAGLFSGTRLDRRFSNVFSRYEHDRLW